MFCPACHKRLPDNDRFCAYCGTNLGYRVLPGVTLPRLILPARWHLSGGMAAVLGGVLGLSLAMPFTSMWVGVFVGALGMGASAMYADVAAGAIPDQAAAERFARALGALGGAL